MEDENKVEVAVEEVVAEEIAVEEVVEVAQPELEAEAAPEVI